MEKDYQKECGDTTLANLNSHMLLHDKVEIDARRQETSIQLSSHNFPRNDESSKESKVGWGQSHKVHPQQFPSQFTTNCETPLPILGQ